MITKFKFLIPFEYVKVPKKNRVNNKLFIIDTQRFMF